MVDRTASPGPTRTQARIAHRLCLASAAVPHIVIPMPPLILASASEARRAMLHAAGIAVTVDPARIDEAAIRAALAAEGAGPRDIADALAEAKARKRSGRHPGQLVLGADQVLEHRGDILSKAEDVQALTTQLRRLRGETHQLLSAAVLYLDGQPIWRHVGVARLAMRRLSDDAIATYVARNWENVHGCVGGYRIEAEGIRLFERIDGDYHAILGLPLVQLLNHFANRGELDP